MNDCMLRSAITPYARFVRAILRRLSRLGIPVTTIGASCLALTLAFAWIPAASAASLVNGGHVSSAITTTGGQDSYTFTANVGESVWLRIADTSNSNFSPRIMLYDPAGTLIGSYWNSKVAGVAHTATTTGTYTVVVSDNSGNYTGTYNLYFVRVPGANEEGALINGGARSGAIELGDLDTYTFTANVGENVWLRIADTGNSGFDPRITLYDPSGAYISSYWDSKVAGVAHTATTAGTHTVVISDSYGNYTGTYDLHFVRLPGANENGSLGNGSTRSETIDLGDLDTYTFDVASNASIQLTITDTSNSGFDPRITLYDPSGAYVTHSYNSSAASIVRSLGNAGTYTVVVSDNGGSNTGSYTLALTGTGITSGDNPVGNTSGDGDVPLPAWALTLMAAGLLGAMHRRQTS